MRRYPFFSRSTHIIKINTFINAFLLYKSTYQNSGLSYFDLKSYNTTLKTLGVTVETFRIRVF